MKIYVGNLSYDATEDDLRQAFANNGEVVNANIIKDKNTGRSRGFGFVEMSSDEEGQAAIDGLNGTDLCGRSLNVSIARERT
jgi:RNA recognition motif-containing protein